MATDFSTWGYNNTQPIIDGQRPYVISLNVSNTSGTSNTTYLFTQAHCQVANCGDLRFGLADGTNLPYWVETEVATNVWKVWVNVTGNGNVIAYYGNAGASSASDGYATFPLFDHFTVAVGSNWTQSGTVSQSGTEVTLTASSNSQGLTSANTFASGNSTRFKVKYRETNVAHVALGFYATAAETSTTYGYVSMRQAWSDGQDYPTTSGGTAQTQTGNVAYSSATYYTYEIKRGSSSVLYTIDDGSITTHSSNVPPSGGLTPVRLWNNNGAQIIVDWIFVRPYAATSEPNWVTWGEEQLTGIPAITSYSPTYSPVDIASTQEVASFSVDTDISANITWYVNSTLKQTDTGVITSSYSNGSMLTGYWNITVVATNANGSVSRTWLYTVRDRIQFQNLQYRIDNHIADGQRPYVLSLNISNSTGTNNATHVFFNGNASPKFKDIRVTINNYTQIPFCNEAESNPCYSISRTDSNWYGLWVNLTQNGTVNIFYGYNPSTLVTDPAYTDSPASSRGTTFPFSIDGNRTDDSYYKYQYYPNQGQLVFNHPMADNSTFYFTTYNQGNSPWYLYVFNETLGLQWTLELPAISGATVPYKGSDGLLYVQSVGYMTVVNLSNQSKANQYTTNFYEAELNVYNDSGDGNHDTMYYYSAESNGLVKRYLFNGTIVGTFSLTSYASPNQGALIVGNMLYIRDNRPGAKFYAIYENNMTEAWNLTLNYTQYDSYNAPTYDSNNNQIYVADAASNRLNGCVYAIDPNARNFNWSYCFPAGTGSVTQHVSYHNDTVFAPQYSGTGTGTGHYYALYANNGTVKWSKSYNNDDGWHVLFLDNNYAYTLSNDDSWTANMYIISQQTGDVVAAYPSITGSWCGSAFLYNGTFYQGLGDRIVAYSIGTGTPLNWSYKGGNDQYNTYYVGQSITKYYPFRDERNDIILEGTTPSASVSGGYLNIGSGDSTSGARSSNQIQYGYMRATVKYDSAAATHSAVGFYSATDAVAFQPWSDGKDYQTITNGGSQTQNNTLTYSADLDYVYQIFRNSTAGEFIRNGSSWTATTNVPDDLLNIKFLGNGIHINDTIVATNYDKYSPVAWATWSAPQNNPDFADRPPTPANLQYTSGNYWVNHTWQAGSGVVTDSYNVSVNGTWYNDTTATYYNHTGLSLNVWSNITVWAWNNTGVLSSASVSQNVQLSDNIFIPPDPANLQNTTGSFWINHTWSAGAGNNTNSYNVSVNGTWYNSTTNLFYNHTGLSPHVWSNITVWAYNSSDTGTLSTGNVSENTQIANTAPTQDSIGAQFVTAGNWLNFSIISSDSDSDSLTYGTNASKGALTGNNFNWSTTVDDAGNYYWYFNTSDGYGGVASEAIAITVTANPTYSISGYVFDQNSAPINSVTVANGSNTTTTNSLGYYTISGWTNGNYNLTYTKTGFNPTFMNLLVNGANLVNQNITLNDTTAPAQVSGLINGTVSTSTINISWTASGASDLWGYQIFRNGTHLGYTQNNYYNDTGLTASTLYNYSVRANDTYNNWGTNSTVLDVITSATAPESTPTPTPTATSGTGTSGGGGGGGGTGGGNGLTVTNNTQFFERRDINIVNGVFTSANFTTNGVVTQINIYGQRNYVDGVAQVSILKQNPSTSNITKVYVFFDIAIDTALMYYTEPTFTIRVPHYLAASNKIKVYELYADSWQEIKIDLQKIGSDYDYYYVQPEHLSTYAIVLEGNSILPDILDIIPKPNEKTPAPIDTVVAYISSMIPVELSQGDNIIPYSITNFMSQSDEMKTAIILILFLVVTFYQGRKKR